MCSPPMIEAVVGGGRSLFGVSYAIEFARNRPVPLP